MTRDRRLVAAIAGMAIVAAVAVILIVSGAEPPRIAEPLSTAPVHAPIASALPDVPSPTVPPTNTALPLPQGAGVAAFTSAPISPPPAARTATPTPDPAVWRFEGRVVDESGASLSDVCVVIGPRGCQRVSPHTDDRGVYWFDVPQNPSVVYDLYFEKDGFVTAWTRTQPTAPTVFNVVLHRTTSRSEAGPSEG